MDETTPKHVLALDAARQLAAAWPLPEEVVDELLVWVRPQMAKYVEGCANIDWEWTHDDIDDRAEMAGWIRDDLDLDLHPDGWIRGLEVAMEICMAAGWPGVSDG